MHRTKDAAFICIEFIVFKFSRGKWNLWVATGLFLHKMERKMSFFGMDFCFRHRDVEWESHVPQNTQIFIYSIYSVLPGFSLESQATPAVEKISYLEKLWSFLKPMYQAFKLFLCSPIVRCLYKASRISIKGYVMQQWISWWWYLKCVSRQSSLG